MIMFHLLPSDILEQILSGAITIVADNAVSPQNPWSKLVEPPVALVPFGSSWMKIASCPTRVKEKMMLRPVTKRKTTQEGRWKPTTDLKPRLSVPNEYGVNNNNYNSNRNGGLSRRVQSDTNLFLSQSSTPRMPRRRQSPTRDFQEDSESMKNASWDVIPPRPTRTSTSPLNRLSTTHFSQRGSQNSTATALPPTSGRPALSARTNSTSTSDLVGLRMPKRSTTESVTTSPQHNLDITASVPARSLSPTKTNGTDEISYEEEAEDNGDIKRKEPSKAASAAVAGSTNTNFQYRNPTSMDERLSRTDEDCVGGDTFPSFMDSPSSPSASSASSRFLSTGVKPRRSFMTSRSLRRVCSVGRNLGMLPFVGERSPQQRSFLPVHLLSHSRTTTTTSSPAQPPNRHTNATSSSSSFSRHKDSLTLLRSALPPDLLLLEEPDLSTDHLKKHRTRGQPHSSCE